MALLVLLIGVGLSIVVFTGIKGVLVLTLVTWCILPLLDGKKLQKSRVTATVIIAATTALLWWKGGWLLGVSVGLIQLVAAIGWQSSKEERAALRSWADNLFED
jgi:hypothetical protein